MGSDLSIKLYCMRPSYDIPCGIYYEIQFIDDEAIYLSSLRKEMAFNIKHLSDEQIFNWFYKHFDITQEDKRKLNLMMLGRKK